MEFISEKEIKSDKKLNELDKFAFKFIRILEKHTEYVIVSGYVSIVLGRTRATEDIDIFIRRLSKKEFSNLYAELKSNGFWCLNAEDEDELYEFLEDNLAIRFAREGFSIPNFEVKFPKDALDEETFDNFISLVLSEGKLKISSLERQIAFKRYYLGSSKDNEDADHVEELFKSHIDYDKVKKYKELIGKRLKNEDK